MGIGIGKSGPQQRGLASMSVFASLLRQNFWLFGWPVSLLFIWFVRRNRYLVLMAGFVAAEYLYRVVAPKTVVATTGPIYVTEIVPLLALATASGMVELKRWLETKGFANGKSAIISVVLASTIIGIMCFWPFHVASMRDGAMTWRFPYSVLEDQNIPKALIFANLMVPLHANASWAYYPPNPSPNLDDDIIFVRIPEEKEKRASAINFWQRRFPDRPAWVYIVSNDEPPRMMPLFPFRLQQQDNKQR